MEYKLFQDIDIYDFFFDSLREAYTEFNHWFIRKSNTGAKALVDYDENGRLQAFLYLKIENGPLIDIDPVLENKKRLKIGTFKINAHGTILGERFIKKILDFALLENVDEVYATIFDEHEGLIELLSTYGFAYHGTKTTQNGVEQVYLRNMKLIHNHVLLDYPYTFLNGHNKYVLSIKPQFHSKMFPDSLLNNENYNIIQDISHTNSIHKVYISFIEDAAQIKPRDIICMYRSSDGLGAARFRSVITSICVVEEVKTKRDFQSVEERIKYANKYNIFTPQELCRCYNKDSFTTIKMTYNIALTRRVTNGDLQDMGISPTYWGFFPLTEEQFSAVIMAGQINRAYLK